MSFLNAYKRLPTSTYIARQMRRLRWSSASSALLSQLTHHHNYYTTCTSPLKKKQKRNFFFSTCTSIKTNNKPGLFSLPHLHQPSDFINLANQAIQTCNNLRQQIHNSVSSSSSSPPHSSSQLSPQQTLYILDDISNTICSIIDASELCRSVHTSPQWRQYANQTFILLSNYIADLNTDEILYHSLVPITSNPKIFNHDLKCDQERRMAILLQKEFERDGIHLSKERREVVKELNGRITELEMMFGENITKHELIDIKNDNESIDHYGPNNHDLVKDVKDIIPNHILSSFPKQNHNSTSSITLSTEPHIVNTILRHSPSSPLRQSVYMQSNTSCVQNLSILDELIKYRHELASTIGYASYSHYFTIDKMAGNPKNVRNFLQNVGKACEKRYKHDMELLKNAKRHVEGNSKLEPWDMNFYNGLVKAHLFRDDESDNYEENLSLGGYFTVDQSLEGMKVLVHKLFRIQMNEVPIQIEEQWDVTNNNDNSTTTSATENKSMIRKFEFFNEEDESQLGTIYLDLHPREGKYAHAAHFTIRCGCEARDIDDNNVHNNISNHQYQLPIVAVVCNLSPPFTTIGSSTATSLLSHSEVETLFHEFGHALHSLLSRSKFQHLSGTRAAMDFVETPSHLMEYYVWDETFLNIIGRHYITGEPIPKKSLENLIKSRNLFKAIEVRTQVVYSLFDQLIFGPPEDWSGVNSDSGNIMSTTDLFAELHRQYDVPYAEGTHWHSRFGHLVTYGAGYYSYLYASMFSADLWNTCFDGGAKAFSSDVGMKYWKEILIHGGAKDPNLMLRTMLDRDPKPDEFFRF